MILKPLVGKIKARGKLDDNLRKQKKERRKKGKSVQNELYT